ncbi:MAG: MFS transporter, partial [Candidatus Methanomethylophilaceae archaeon]|nr:MFS transporter [Candidatus Methanomethylophilaceae archaeon]
MTKMTWTVLLIIGIGWMFDAMDQGMVSGVIAAIGTDWQLSLYDKSWLTSSGIIGMIIGAALSGNIADRWGRRKVIVVTLLLYSLGSFLSGLSTEYWMLIVFRFITGFGLGGELPVASAMVTEMSPARYRGRNVVLLESFWAWGWIAASLVAYLVIPEFGWRAAFFVGAVPALFAAVLRQMVPESPRYLEIAGKHDQANAIVS